MKNLVSDIVSFIRSLSFMNVLFFAAVILLIVLVVSLMYIMRINKEVEVEDEAMDEVNDELDLKNISRVLEDSPSKPISLNSYEKEQEEKAIISYDELIALQNYDKEKINYKSEEDIEGLKVKSVDLDNLKTKIELPKIKNSDTTVSKKVYDYKKEEEFLEALKRLQKSL